MGRVFFTSLIALLFVCPAMATGISKDAESADCTESVLGVKTGTTNLEADWAANTINLEWYNGKTKLSENTCTYDGGISVPSAPAAPDGYTFGGWRVKFGSDILAPFSKSINGSTVYGRGWYNNDYICATNGRVGADICSREGFSGLAVNEWKTIFSYGTIKGNAVCSAKGGSNSGYSWSGPRSEWTATTTELTNASGEAHYCWCQITGFAETDSSTYQSIESPLWVYSSDVDDDVAIYMGRDYLCSICVRGCSSRLSDSQSFRNALIGVTK